MWKPGAALTDHGTRRTYRRGCRCCPCRAANAAAQAQRRADRRHCRYTRGLRVSSAEAYKRLRQLKAERVSQYALARRLGLKNDSLRLHPDAITVRKLVQIKRIYDAYMAEGPDTPLHAAV